MASSSEKTRARKSLTTDEVIEGIFADEDSENEDFDSESEESEEEKVSDVANKNDTNKKQPSLRGAGRVRRGVYEQEVVSEM